MDCTFNHVGPGGADEAYAQCGQYTNAAQNVAEVSFILLAWFALFTIEVYARSSLAIQTILHCDIGCRSIDQSSSQPDRRCCDTGQAFLFVKGAQYLHPVERTLLVSEQMVQIRLSVLASTIIIACLAVVIAALVFCVGDIREQWRSSFRAVLTGQSRLHGNTINLAKV